MEKIKFAIAVVALAASVFLTACEAKPKEDPDWQDAALMEARASVSSAPADRPTETSRGTPIIYDDDVPEDISWQNTPQSDCFSRVGYCPGTETLGVTFRESGSTYYYYSVPSSIWKDLSSADSPGSYYNKHIKGKYTCEKEG